MSQPLPVSLYTAEQVRELDRIAIEAFGIEGFELMNRAGKDAFNTLCSKWPQLLKGDKSLQIFCGAGNNGGDGYIVAGLAKQHGIPVSVCAIKPVNELKGDAKRAWSFCHNLGVDVQPFDHSVKVFGDVIVDAMLGTGLKGDVRGDFRLAIEKINLSNKPVLAIDIPSGLCADSGSVLGAAINAVATVTFIGMKQGLLTAMGPLQAGELVFSGLDVPESVYKHQESQCQRISHSTVSGVIRKRPKHAHKGMYGSVLLVGGNYGMPGAVIMAAEAAMACGAGRVTVLTRSEYLSALAVRIPEVMATSVNSGDDFKQLVKNKDAIVIGPGLGQDRWALNLLQASLAAELPLLIDADALNLIADDSQLLCNRKFPIILTPHPGEAARLLNTSASTIQDNRFDSVVTIQQRFGVTAVLKGAGTLIASEEGIRLCSSGNPGMAVAGMGDVLSGVIGALLGQGLSAHQAATLGVWLHSSAADDVVLEQGEVGMLATTLIPYIRNRLNHLIARG